MEKDLSNKFCLLVEMARIKSLSSRFGANLLVIIGICVGTIAILSPWPMALTLCGYWGPNAADTALDTFSGICWNMPSDISLAASLFIIGTIFAFVTPISAIIQLTGVAIFFQAFQKVWGSNPILEGRIITGIGPYIGMVSSLIMIIGMIAPYWIGYNAESKGLWKRALTFQFKRKSTDGNPHSQ